MQYGAQTESRLASASQDKAEHQLGTLQGLGKCIQWGKSLRARLFGAKFSVSFQTGSLGPPSLLYNA